MNDLTFTQALVAPWQALPRIMIKIAVLGLFGASVMTFAGAFHKRRGQERPLQLPLVAPVPASPAVLLKSIPIKHQPDLVAMLPAVRSGCGGIFDPSCNLSLGKNMSLQTAMNAEGAADGSSIASAARNLENFINVARNTVVNSSSPIPDQMRYLLTGYASETSLNMARYKVGADQFDTWVHILDGDRFSSAVTLGDVIVFRGEREAADPATWAHELKHVDQYAEYGLHNFAIEYVRDPNSIDQPAFAMSSGYWAWAQAQGRAGPAQLQFQGVSSSDPLSNGTFCYTSIGKFGPGPAQPFGGPCSVRTPAGVLPGQIGR